MKKNYLLLIMTMMLLLSSCSIKVDIKIKNDDTSSNVDDIPLKSEYHKGYIKDNCYINESLDFKIVPSDNIYMYSEDEMLGYYERTNAFYEEISNFYQKYDKESINIVNELLLHNNITGANLAISSINRFIADLDINSYKDILFEQICSIDDYSIIDSSELEDCNLFGTNFKIIIVSISNSYMTYEKTFLYTFLDDRIVQISIDCISENDFYDYMGCFSYITHQA